MGETVVELVVSIFLGAWIALSGVIAYFYYKNDEEKGAET